MNLQVNSLGADTQGAPLASRGNADAERSIGIIGVPMDVGASRRGTNLGPEALHIAGIADAFSTLGHTVVDRGFVEGPRNPNSAPVNGYRHLDEVNAWCSNIHTSVYDTLTAGETPLILGGDHSLSIGSISGVAQHCAENAKPLSILWIDAHADFNTPQTSPSGNIHGMPLAALTGLLPGGDINVGRAPDIIDPANIHLVGIRSVDPVEKSTVIDRGLSVYDMRTVDEHGMVSVMRQILNKVAATGGHLHVSFDLDFIDPDVAPGVGTPVAGGATWREAHLCMEMIHESQLMGSLDLVELNPCLDHSNKSATLAVDLACSAFGKQIINRKAVTP